MATTRPEVTSRKTTVRGPKKPVSDRLVYTIGEAARLLGLGRNAAYQAAARGELPTIKLGRLLRVPKAALHRLVGGEVPSPRMSADGADSVDDAEQPSEETEQ
jgi:excisionase family DNA binding protein